jgi:hypothetical protein
MNHGLVKVSDVIGDFKPRPIKTAISVFTPPVIKAPIPKPPRVIGDPTRTPVNRQAAMLLSKPTWLTDPLPPELPKTSELPRLREENVKLKATNERLVAENSSLRRRVERLTVLACQKPKTIIVKQELPPEPKRNSTKEKLLERLTQ